MKPKSIQLEIKYARWKQDLRDQRGLEMKDNRFVAYERYDLWGSRRIHHVFCEMGDGGRFWAGTSKYYISRGCGTRAMTVCQTRW